MLTVANSPITGFNPGGQVAGPVVTEKLIRPLRGWIGPLLPWMWPGGLLLAGRVWQAKSTSTTAMTASLPSPATDPEQVTVVPLLVHTMGLLGTSCGFAAKAVEVPANSNPRLAKITRKMLRMLRVMTCSFLTPRPFRGV